MDANTIMIISIIVPIIIGIGIYFSPGRYPSVITRIDRFADWIHKKREELKNDKSTLRYIKYIIFIPFDILMKLTEKIDDRSIRSAIRVASSMYLSYIVLWVIQIIFVVVIVIILVLIALVLLAIGAGPLADYNRSMDQDKRDARQIGIENTLNDINRKL